MAERRIPGLLTNADSALAEASRTLSIERMRAALRAGGSPTIAVMRVAQAGQTLAAEADFDDRQVAAMRLLAEFAKWRADEPVVLVQMALHAAVKRHGGPGVVNLLVELGADVRATSNFHTPLHQVCRADTARALLAAGADVNASPRGGVLPIHLGTRDPGVVRVLLEAGADVDARDLLCRTPLLHAVRELGSGGRRSVRVLLTRGADPTVASVAGDTPLETAVRNANELAVEGLHVIPSAMSLCVDSVHCARWLARAIAWRRRRHMLLVIRMRGGYRVTGSGGAARGLHAAVHDGVE